MQIEDSGVLFCAGTAGYHTYRIPALLKVGVVLLAFCEGRRDTNRDTGQIDLLVKRSLDGGRSWSAQKVVFSRQGYTCGNPCPIYDRETGTVLLLFCQHSAETPESALISGEGARTVWMTRSEDCGQRWSQPFELTQAVKPGGWRWYATGPGHGLQLESGRLVVPCDHVLPHPDGVGDLWRSHVILSDDHGASWRLGGVVETHGGNESTIVEMSPDALYINCRYHNPVKRRLGAWSEDGGESFVEAVVHDSQRDPTCQGSMVNVGGELWLSHVGHETRRLGLVVQRSLDSGRAWGGEALIWPGPVAYSDLSVLEDGVVLCLFERGESHPYEGIGLLRLSVEA